jgi:hypothetical protein
MNSISGIFVPHEFILQYKNWNLTENGKKIHVCIFVARSLCVYYFLYVHLWHPKKLNMCSFIFATFGKLHILSSRITRTHQFNLHKILKTSRGICGIIIIVRDEGG